MIRSLRARFILSHILPILIVLPIVSIALLYLLETQILLKDMADNLEDRAQFIAGVVEREPNIWQDPAAAQSFAQSITIFVNGRLLILGSSGELLGSNDSAFDDQIGNVIPYEGLSSALDGQSNVIQIYSLTNQSAEVLIPVTDIREELIGIIAVTETLEGVGPLFERVRWFVIGLLGIEILLGVIVAVILAARLEKPISQAAEAVISISEGERISPVPLSGPAEIRRLSTAVNVLSERLRVLEETRRQMLANLVHEIGRPLGAIRAAVHVLLTGGAEDEATKDELLLGIEDEVTRLQPLLDDLAQLHGVVLGLVTLDRKKTELSTWLPSILLPWRAAALEKGIDWSASIDPYLPAAYIDPDRMGQVVGNLLSNAIKYTPADGQISVTADKNSSGIWIVVSDSGPGIQPNEHEKVFEPFYRSSRERRFPQGLGLGLTIARDLVEAHGGSLEVESTGEKGSRFTIRLPIDGKNETAA